MENISELIEKNDEFSEAISLVMSSGSGEQAQLIKDISDLRSVRAGHFLTALYDKTADKVLQKAIKKALFRLKSQGIAVEEPRPSGESVLLHKSVITRQAQALMSTYDNELNRVVVTAFELKKNLFVVSPTVIHLSKGLLELKSLPVSRADLVALMNEYRNDLPAPMVIAPISPVYSGYLIDEASKISGKYSAEVHSLIRHLNDVPGDVRKPTDIYSLPMEESITAAAMAEIVSDPALTPIHLEWKDMEEDRQAFDKAANPTIVLPPYVIQERTEVVLKEMVTKERLKAMVPRLKRMLEDMAYHFYCLGRIDRYKSIIGALKDETGLAKYLIFFVQKTFYDLAKKTVQSPEVIIDPFSRPNS